MDLTGPARSSERGAILIQVGLAILALTAFTIGSAYVNHLDEETGTLEVGKLADMVVLDRDIASPEAGTLGDGPVIATFVEGEAGYDALPAGKRPSSTPRPQAHASPLLPVAAAAGARYQAEVRHG